jgi:hypothetical protein
MPDHATPQDPAHIEAHQASRFASTGQARTEYVVREALAALNPQADDAQQPYAVILRRLQEALEREVSKAVAPEG